MSEKAQEYLIQMTCDCGNGKSLIVTLNAPRESSVKDINAHVDKVNRIFDRQRAFHEMPLLEEKIEGTQFQIDSMEADIEMFKKQHPNLKAGTPHEQNLRKQEANVAAAKVALARGQLTYEQTKARTTED